MRKAPEAPDGEAPPLEHAFKRSEVESFGCRLAECGFTPTPQPYSVNFSPYIGCFDQSFFAQLHPSGSAETPMLCRVRDLVRDSAYPNSGILPSRLSALTWSIIDGSRHGESTILPTPANACKNAEP